MNNMGLGIAMNVKGNFKTALQGVHSRWSKFRAGIKAGVAGIGARMSGLGARLKTFKSNWLGVTASLVAGVVVFKKLIGISVKFQQGIANVASVSGESQKELSKLARVAGMNTVFSAREAADAMYFLASAGLKINDMGQVLTPTLNLAAAAQMGIAEATDLVVNNLKVFRVEMSQAQEFTDVMAKTVASANTDMQQLGAALSYSGATASVAGVKFKDLNAILATMADQGVKGTRAGTQIRMAFTRLMKPTSGAKKVLDKYGISSEKISKLLPTPIKLFEMLNKANLSQADALTILGTRQANVFSIIKTGIPRMKELQKTLEDAGGTAEEMALIQVDTLSGAMKLLKSAFEEIIISGSEGLLPVFKGIVGGLIKVMRAFIRLPEPVKKLIGVITFLIPLILILTKVVMAFGVAFSAAIWPVTLIVAGIAALIAIGYLLRKHWTAIGEFFKHLWAQMKAGALVFTNAVILHFLYMTKGVLWSMRIMVFGIIDGVNLAIRAMNKIAKTKIPLIPNPLIKVQEGLDNVIQGRKESLKLAVDQLKENERQRRARSLAAAKAKAEKETGKDIVTTLKTEAEKATPEVTVNNKINIGNEKVHDSQKDYIKEYNLRNFVYVR